MINKFEAVGIFASIACMVLALFLLRVEATPGRIGSATEEQPAAVVVAVDTENETQAVADALSQSLAANGSFEKLVLDDVVVGYGDAAKVGDTVTVEYVGRLQNGQEFDNSYKKGAPFTFTLGENRVIEGWEKGILSMRTGGERILVVPPDLAYGSSNVGPIPANSTLVFAVKMVSIETHDAE